MATAAALASVFLAILAAPLILATGTVLCHAAPRMRVLWLGLIALLLLAAFAAGSFALVLQVI
jgi:hypothetical protein